MCDGFRDEAFDIATAGTRLFERESFEHLADVDCLASDDILVKSLVNQSSYVGKKLTTKSSVPANIHKLEFREFWMNVLKPDDLVRDTIENGYKLPFIEEPPDSFEQNNFSARNDMDFVRAEVKRLESLRCIVKTSVRPKLVLPLSSVFSKKKRLVVDGSRCLNPYLKKRKVRLSDLRDIPDFVGEGDYLCADDLDSGYWHLGVNPDYYKYLGIHVPEEDGSISFYFWRVLFLGISDAVFIFSAILKPVIVFVHTLGHRSGIYIDDVLTVAKSFAEALKSNKVVCDVLAKSGWVIKPEQKMGPSQRLVYLGLEICTKSMQFFIPVVKMERLLSKLRAVVEGPSHLKVRQIASVLGLLMSCYKALGPVTRLMTRTNYSWIQSSLQVGDWDSFAGYTKDCRKEFMFWLENLDQLNGFSFSAHKSEDTFEMEIVGDASEVGLFAFKYGDVHETVARRMFSSWEARESSTYREVVVLHETYCSPEAVRLSGRRIRHLTDNKAVEWIFKTGSRNFKIQKLVVEVFLACHSLQIFLVVSWRSRDDPLLQVADAGSRDFDGSSYSLDFSSFLVVLESFSYLNLSVDAMAQAWNKKFPLYFSRLKDPLALGQNFFAQKLSSDVGYYIFPPPKDIVAVLLHLRRYGAYGVLLLPMWPSSSFFNFVFPDGKHPGVWAVNLIRFRPEGFLWDPCVRSSTFKNNPSFDMVAIHFSFLHCGWECFSSSLRDSRLCLDWGCSWCQ